MNKLERLFNVGDRVMLKSNLLIIEICKLLKHNEYEVFYPHIKGKHTFVVKEDELQEKPCDNEYNRLIFGAYIEYRVKYEKLIENLYTPSVRK